jgi:hypothetical protein
MLPNWAGCCTPVLRWVSRTAVPVPAVSAISKLGAERRTKDELGLPTSAVDCGTE